MPPIRAVFFDLDDTLCAYWDAAKAGLREAFAEVEVPGVTAEQMRSHWAAAYWDFCPCLKKLGWYDRYLVSGKVTRDELMRLALTKAGIDDPELAVRLGDAYGAARNRNLHLFPDALHVLETLHAKVPLGLVTNGSADVQRQEIATCGIERFLGPDRIFIEGEQGEGKPLRSVFERARASVGFAPDEILFVGNSYGHDIAPAIEFGMRTYWVRRASDVPPARMNEDGARPEERPETGPEPTYERETLRDLLQLEYA